MGLWVYGFMGLWVNGFLPSSVNKLREYSNDHDFIGL